LPTPLLPNLKFVIGGNQKSKQSLCDLITYPHARGKHLQMSKTDSSSGIENFANIADNFPDNTQHTWQTKSYY